MKYTYDNNYVKAVYVECMRKYRELIKNTVPCEKQLDYSQAVMIKTSDYVLLRSCGDLIAAYNIYTSHMFEFLQFVPGYTPADVQSIAKFLVLTDPDELFLFYPE